jgi:hypothetical protein
VKIVLSRLTIEGVLEVHTNMSTNPMLEIAYFMINFITTLTVDDIWNFVINAPHYYSTWWQNLLRESPQHVFIETALVAFIIWLVFIRKTVDPKRTSSSEKLSSKEVQWLIDTWKPEPLVPPLSAKENAIADDFLVRINSEMNELFLSKYLFVFIVFLGD